ncbi:hypothetical protein LGQ02_14510 [Bacillus shivajii]|uniref:hypothetical protein n=1 Tax=Bacillus shivajii TaxID=1983719 RepID=UPI001CFB7349|nr:hypothetical protein [Bacillus shivajii]UCZ52054.1 hypothetical protein LGQ02_14510 [Bacillus shivajii]
MLLRLLVADKQCSCDYSSQINSAPAVTRRSSKQFEEVLLVVAPAVTRRSSKQFEEVLLVADPPRVAVFCKVHFQIKRTFLTLLLWVITE